MSVITNQTGCVFTAYTITRVGIHHGENKPIKIDIEMSSVVGFFRREEVLLTKVESNPAKQYIELTAGVTGEERKRYL